MDHGPFNAVELLQQIGSHAFVSSNILRDTYSNDEKPIEEWEEFASFAEHSQLNREIVAEKKAIEQVVVAEAKGNRYKTLTGVIALVVILGGLAVWFFKVRGARNDAIAVEGEQGINIESAGGLKGEGKKAGARVGTGPGGIPFLAGGMSCGRTRSLRRRDQHWRRQGSGRSDRRSVRRRPQQRLVHRCLRDTSEHARQRLRRGAKWACGGRDRHDRPAQRWDQQQFVLSRSWLAAQKGDPLAVRRPDRIVVAARAVS